MHANLLCCKKTMAHQPHSRSKAIENRISCKHFKLEIKVSWNISDENVKTCVCNWYKKNSSIIEKMTIIKARQPLFENYTVLLNAIKDSAKVHIFSRID